MHPTACAVKLQHIINHRQYTKANCEKIVFTLLPLKVHAKNSFDVNRCTECLEAAWKLPTSSDVNLLTVRMMVFFCTVVEKYEHVDNETWQTAVQDRPVLFCLGYVRARSVYFYNVSLLFSSSAVVNETC